DLDFFHQIGTHQHGRIGSVGVVIPSVVGGQTVAGGVHLADLGSRENRHITEDASDLDYAGRGGDKVQNVPALHRQTEQLGTRQRVSDRCAGGGEQGIRLGDDVDALRSRAHFQGKVLPDLLVLA